MNTEGPSPIDDILRLCPNFVILDSEQHVFRFAHQSVQEYLEKKEEYGTRRNHAYAASRCFDIYSTKSELKSRGTPTTLQQVKRKMQQANAFRPYARLYCPVHYRSVEGYDNEDLRRSLMRFTEQNSIEDLLHLQRVSDYIWQPTDRDSQSWVGEERDSKAVPPFWRWSWDFHCNYEKRYDHYWELNSALETIYQAESGYALCRASARPYNVLNAACVFGFETFLKTYKVSSDDVNLRLRHGLRDREATPLHMATVAGHSHIVRFLIQKGADVNAL